MFKMKRVYAIRFKDKTFLYGEPTNVVPELYASVKAAQADLEWLDLENDPKIVEVEVKVK